MGWESLRESWVVVVLASGSLTNEIYIPCAKGGRRAHSMDVYDNVHGVVLLGGAVCYVVLLCTRYLWSMLCRTSRARTIGEAG